MHGEALLAIDVHLVRDLEAFVRRWKAYLHIVESGSMFELSNVYVASHRTSSYTGSLQTKLQLTQVRLRPAAHISLQEQA